jgi:hypothetical protein
MNQKTTLLTHIYNEEYLLPLWLEHHKDMFDDIVVVDYRSTDRSLEICRKICPKCQIITTKNGSFGAEIVDKEMMEIENGIQGIKMILNTTEFLFVDKPIKEIFEKYDSPVSLYVNAVSPYSKEINTIYNNDNLIEKLLDPSVVYHNDRGVRQIHNYANGAYTVGRHGTENTSIESHEMSIVWLGYFPMNDTLLKRKTQIQNNIPQEDKDTKKGEQHLYSEEKILSINEEKANSGIKLEEINNKLYNIIIKKLENKGHGIVYENFVSKNDDYSYYLILLIIPILFLFIYRKKISKKFFKYYL